MSTRENRPGDPWRSPRRRRPLGEMVRAVVEEVRDVVEDHPRFCAGFIAGLLACAVACVGVAVARALLS